MNDEDIILGIGVPSFPRCSLVGRIFTRMALVRIWIASLVCKHLPQYLFLRPLTKPSKLCSYSAPFSASYPESLLLITGVLVAVAHLAIGMHVVLWGDECALV